MLSSLSRIRLIAVFFMLAAVVLITRLYFVQVVQGDTYGELADRQYVRPQTGLFDRGTIFFEDKDGNRTAGATLASGFTLFINPQILTDPSDVYDKLSRIVALDQRTFFLRAGKTNDPYEEIAHRLSQTQAQKIQEFSIPGVQVYRERWRLYPGGNRAAQTLGFLGFKGDSFAGRYGLERYYNDVLERTEGEEFVNFFAQAFSGIANRVRGSAREGDIVLTIEPSVQTFLEKTLTEISQQWSSRSSGGIIIDPITGRVIALATDPSFDLNAFQNVSDTQVFTNPLVENVFEMGSVIKPLTVAAGIDTGVVTPQTQYFDSGFVQVDDARIANHDRRGRGDIPLQEVLNQSLNTGAVFVQQKIGNKRFAEYLLSFGIGEETGVDLPGEIPGLVSNLTSPRNVEYATASFGQGIALTPIATVRAVSALANGGKLITPHVVSRIEYGLGDTKNIFYTPEEHVITQETSEEITRMLVRAVDEALLGGSLALPRHSVAAKTGTAQIANLEEGGYYDDRFFHSFFGYFPAFEPRFLMFLYTSEPKEVRFASETLARPFMDTARFLINYYEIPPDR